MGDKQTEPFIGSWAVEAGVMTRWELRKNFARVAPNTYVPRGHQMDAIDRAKAAVHWTKGQGVLIGRSAAALHGTKWIADDTRAEIAVRTFRRTPEWISATQHRIPSADRCFVGDYPVTTPIRTAFDLSCRLPEHEAVPVLDALCRATALTPGAVIDFCDQHPGERGCAIARTTLAHVDPGAESPPESLTRLCIVNSGLPAPETQIVIRDQFGAFIARIDMGWREARVGVEYDGAQHWTDPAQRTKDIDRIALLEAQGWRIIRVSANLLYARPHVFLDRIHQALNR
ncbi:DUF559 domain-containing protein [Nocardia camponoti]|nr:DUF559 domain-containing protein [Nocardia camponoti]